MKGVKQSANFFMEAELPLDTVLNPGVIMLDHQEGFKNENTMNFNHSKKTEKLSE